MDQYPRYNFRDRDAINLPSRYDTNTTEEITLNEKISRLRQQCAAKKKSITKRIETIDVGILI